MRLLSSRSRQLEGPYDHPPPYAIVSHRWGNESEEVLFSDISNETLARSKVKGYRKMLGFCAQAIRDDLNHVWLDTCCIDKSNSTELAEAINSMYGWYQRSEVCYAYLHDVGDPQRFTESDWFMRGWTLQELIAPKRLKFFTRDWTFIGTREDLMDPIAERTGISRDILQTGNIPPEVTISQKMAWAAYRETTKVEDRAYSLLGILGINVVPVYGIENDALGDLQHKLVSKYADQTLFAWYHVVTPPEDGQMMDGHAALGSANSDTSTPSPLYTGLLASSPSRYLESYEIPEPVFRDNYVDRITNCSYRSHFFISNNLVQISVPMKHIQGRIWRALLRCSLEPPNEGQIQRPLTIYLEEIQPWEYIRVHFPSDEREGVEDGGANEVKDVPGSLEQLSGTELLLEGYALRDVAIVGQHGEISQVESRTAPRVRLLKSSMPERTPHLSAPLIIPDLTNKIIRADNQYCEAGGFGDVFQCRYLADDDVREVAVKAFRFNFLIDENNHTEGKAVRKIRRELGIWRRLKHRNIVPFLGIAHGFGKEGSVALVSLWMPHGTLHTFLETQGDRLIVSHRLQLLLDIANGLHYLHSFPLIHGDLTGHNVLLDNDYNACLTDFGCASLVGDLPQGLTYLNQSTVRPGALRWAAPEHFLLDEEETMHTIKSDIYSFGNMALFVLSGTYPWSEVRADAAVMLRLSQGYKPARPLSRAINNEHWALIERCWSSVLERPLTEDLVSSLQQFLDSSTVQPRLGSSAHFRPRASIGT